MNTFWGEKGPITTVILNPCDDYKQPMLILCPFYDI